MTGQHQDTIVAIATPNGVGAIGVVRLSGLKAIEIADRIFSGKKLDQQKSHTLHFGLIQDGDKTIDEVLIALFRNPHSYTGEDSIEISAHGSPYVLQQIVSLCIREGARLARPGEFTQRAFMNGKIDLSQAESVADIIAAESASQHALAIKQMRGGYSEQIEQLRQELIDFTALIELELDFSEEDVEFADREQFFTLIGKTKKVLYALIESFRYGNVLKNGVPVAIVGEPNVGKSTLLNALLQEEKAIVSDIAGTTRDYIEDVLSIDGIVFRFVDTAGIRITNDELESKGIERSFKKLKEASIVLYMADINRPHHEIAGEIKLLEFSDEQDVIILLNKADKMDSKCSAYDVEEAVSINTHFPALEIAAATAHNLDKLKTQLVETIEKRKVQTDIQVSNARHLEALKQALAALDKVEAGLMHHVSGEFISIDARLALDALGAITGKISNEDVLSSVFSRFCIGK